MSLLYQYDIGANSVSIKIHKYIYILKYIKYLMYSLYKSLGSLLANYDSFIPVAFALLSV